MPHEALLDRIHGVMRKLMTIKARAVLRSATHLSPALRNATRWSSTFAMVKRFIEIQPAIESLTTASLKSIGAHDIALGERDVSAAHRLLSDLTKLDSVTQELQKDTLTVLAARRLFDHAMTAFPALKRHLHSSATIVNNTAL